MPIIHRSSAHPHIEIFEGKDLSDLLKYISTWLKSEPNISILSINIVPVEEGESVIVCYEI